MIRARIALEEMPPAYGITTRMCGGSSLQVRSFARASRLDATWTVVAAGCAIESRLPGIDMARRDMAYQQLAPDLAALEAMRGLVLLDFGTDWCGHCLAARTAVDAWLHARDGIEHFRIEDGRGRPLGRAFRVKLWPTLVLLRDGHEIARVVRPREARDLWPLQDALD